MHTRVASLMGPRHRHGRERLTGNISCFWHLFALATEPERRGVRRVNEAATECMPRCVLNARDEANIFCSGEGEPQPFADKMACAMRSPCDIRFAQSNHTQRVAHSVVGRVHESASEKRSMQSELHWRGSRTSLRRSRSQLTEIKAIPVQCIRARHYRDQSSVVFRR